MLGVLEPHQRHVIERYWVDRSPTRIMADDAWWISIEQVLPTSGDFVLVVSASVLRGLQVQSAFSAQAPFNPGRTFVVGAHPSFEALLTLRSQIRALEPEQIVSIGGGSVMDAAKFVSVSGARLGQQIELWNVSLSYSDEGSRIAHVAIPTTAGSGSEVSATATVWFPRHRVKNSLEGSDLRPDVAILDPQLLATLSESAALFAEMDACSHAIESMWNMQRNEESLDLATAALAVWCDYQVMPRSSSNGTRPTLSLLASNAAGFAIAITRTSVAHAMSYPLTLESGMPHGLASSLFLPGLLDHFLDSGLPNEQQIGLLRKAQDLLRDYNLLSRAREYMTNDDMIRVLSEAPLHTRAKSFCVEIQPRELIGIVERELRS